AVPGGVAVAVGIQSRLDSDRLSRLNEQNRSDLESVCEGADKTIPIFEVRNYVGPGEGEVLRHVQIRTGPVVGKAIRILGAARVEQAGKKLVGGIVRSVRPSVVGVEREAESRALREAHRGSVVFA